MFNQFFQQAFRGAQFDSGDGDDDSNQMSQEKADTEKLYTILGVSKTATPAQIKKEYFKLAKTHHPDRGGDPEKFREIQTAYEILSDEDKRSVYDKYGLEGLKEGGGGQQDIFEMFNMFSHGGGMGGQKQKKGQMRKYKETKKELKISLENAYNGDFLTIPHTKQKCCDTCNGQGGKNVKTCPECKGHGIVEKMVQLGPGFYSSSRQHCSNCQGEGKILKESDKCKTCKGNKVSNVTTNLEVSIEKGVPDNHPIVCHGEGDEAPGYMAGDVILFVQIQKHDVFERKGADLYMKKKISLLEALTGFNFQVEQLDKSKFTVSTQPQEIISDRMPFYKDTMQQGHLIIEFSVEMPQLGELKKEQQELLSKCLQGPKQLVIPPKEQKEYTMTDFDPDQMNTNEEGGKKAEDEGDEYQQGGTRVQCGQQ